MQFVILYFRGYLRLINLTFLDIWSALLYSNFVLSFIRYPYHILIIVQVIISRDFVANCLVIMFQ